MMIFYKEDILGYIQPTVIIDYTRSDEQYSAAEIKKYIYKLAGKSEFGAWQFRPENIYSLDYTATFTHSGINYGKSLKQHFNATIINAPTELVKLLNIEQYASQQNFDALKTAVNNVIDPKVKFPTGGIVFKTLDGKTITRQFMVYSTPYNFDSKRINSNLQIHGAHFDSMVLRLQFGVQILKTAPLIDQISTKLTATDLRIDEKSLLMKQIPAVEKIYDPKPFSDTLQDICQDNNLAFKIENGIITFQSLDPNSPPDPTVKTKFSFKNGVMGTKNISGFSLNNYVSCEFESEIYDPELFSSVLIYDDSGSKDITGQGGIFSNLTKSPDVVNKLSGYRFYVQEYSLHDSRAKTSATTKATNNWLVNNFKLDYLLENKIYQGVL